MHAVATIYFLLVAAADGGAAPAANPPVLLRAPQPPASTTASGEPSADQYRLVRASDGSGDLTYEAKTFAARIARDGTVSFRDKTTGIWRFVPVAPYGPPSGVPTLEGVIRRRGKNPSKAAVPADPIGDETRYSSTTVSRYRPDPREACTYPRPCFYGASSVLVGWPVGSDLTEALMRLHGKDPYRYEKARFLTATREMRIRLAARAHAEDIQRSADELPRRLTDIVCDARSTVAERRALVTALGEEMDASPEADRSRPVIAQALRRLDDAGRAGGTAVVPGCAPNVRPPPTH